MSNFNLIFQSLRGLYDLPAAPPANDRFLVWSDTGTMSAITFAKLREHILGDLPDIDTEPVPGTIVQRDPLGGAKFDGMVDITPTETSHNLPMLSLTGSGAGLSGINLQRSNAQVRFAALYSGRIANRYQSSGGVNTQIRGGSHFGQDRGAFHIDTDVAASNAAPYLFGLKHEAPDRQFARFTNSDNEDVWQVHSDGRTTGADAVDDKDFVTKGQADSGYVTTSGNQTDIGGNKTWTGRHVFGQGIRIRGDNETNASAGLYIGKGRANEDSGNNFGLAIGTPGPLAGNAGPVFIGTNSGENLENGMGTIAIGGNTLRYSTRSAYSIVLGYEAAKSNPGVGSSAGLLVAIGYRALTNIGPGGGDLSGGIAIGGRALESLSTSPNNIVALGYRAGVFKTSGAGSTLIGSMVGETDIAANADLTGDYNTWVGFQSGPGSPSTVRFSTAVGYRAKNVGISSTAIGRESFSEGISSVALGYLSRAGYINGVALGSHSRTTRNNSVSVGNSTGEGTQIQRQITDVAAGTEPNDAVNLAQMETAVTDAREAVKSDVVNLTDNQTDIGGDKSWTGSHDFHNDIRIGNIHVGGGRSASSSSVRLGQGALNSTSAATENVAIGYASSAVVTGGHNTSVGSGTLQRATAAGGNTAIGRNALTNVTTQQNNTAIGAGAGAALNAGSGGNVFVGRNSGNGVLTAMDCIYIGNQATNVDPNSYVHSVIAIGPGSKVGGATSIAIGRSTNVSVSNSVAIGDQSTNSRIGTVSVGNDTTKRQITNVAAATQPHDVVILQQLQSAVAEGKLADGNYGDVTVSNNASVWTINPNAVTLDKIGNNAVSNAKLAPMPTQTFKGRVSAGAGSPENLTVAQVQSMLGLATTYQPLNGNLSAIAAVPFSANQGLYITADDEVATFPLTAFGRTLVGHANAPAARSALELGTLATQSANSVNITGGTISGIIIDGGSY